MDAALAARLELEVLHRVGDVCLLSRDAGLIEGDVEDPAGRPDEGFSGNILLVARLLADEHDFRRLRPLAKYCLGRVAP